MDVRDEDTIPKWESLKLLEWVVSLGVGLGKASE
jgi:hypothetical protein